MDEGHQHVGIVNELKTKFPGGSDDAAFLFEEDKWTKLSLGMLPHLHPTQYTSVQALKFTSTKATMLELSSSGLHCYLFHGAPDILFENVVVMLLPRG